MCYLKQPHPLPKYAIQGELRLNFLVGIPPNEPIYHEMAPINAVILRVNTDLDTTRKRTTSVTNTRPTPFKTAVGASDSGMRANDRVLLRGSLSNIRLFHILELLMVIYDEYYGAYDEGELISIPRDILPAIVAYIMRSFCTDWRVGDFWSGAHGARVAALLEDPCDDEQIQRFALRFVREFLRRWSTSTCPDLSGWKDLYQWVDYECLTLRSWPMVCRAYHMCPVSSHKSQCRDSRLFFRPMLRYSDGGIAHFLIAALKLGPIK